MSAPLQYTYICLNFELVIFQNVYLNFIITIFNSVIPCKGLSALGVIPVVGEAADAAKVAKMADKAADVARIAGRSSKATKLLNKVSNPKLMNTIKELYRPGAKVGDGGLADAIRHEIKTGNLVGGKSHIQKGTERLRNLERISEREKLTKQERKILEDLIKDLKRALGGK